MSEIPPEPADGGERIITFGTRRNMAIIAGVAYSLIGGACLGAALLIPGVAERLNTVESFAIFFLGGLGSIVGAYFGSTLILNGILRR